MSNFLKNNATLVLFLLALGYLLLRVNALEIERDEARGRAWAYEASNTALTATLNDFAAMDKRLQDLITQRDADYAQIFEKRLAERLKVNEAMRVDTALAEWRNQPLPAFYRARDPTSDTGNGL